MTELQRQGLRSPLVAAPAVGLVLAALLVTAATLSAKDEWKKKPAAQWTREEAVEFLSKSPWAKEVEVWHLTGRQVRETMRQQTQTYSDAPGEPPVQVSSTTSTLAPEQVEGRYRVAWTSAEIVRQGWERLKQLDPALAEMFEPPAASPTHHVVTVRVAKPPEGAPTIFAGADPEGWRARAVLRGSNKREVRAEQAVVHGTGAAAAVSFLFPRAENGQATLSGADWAEFEFESAAGDKLKHRFKLKEMQGGGRPDY